MHHTYCSTTLTVTVFLGYGIEVDLWSLGIILYIMLCGYAPFRNQDRDKLFKLIQNGHYEFEGQRWSHVSEGKRITIHFFIFYTVVDFIVPDNKF